MGGTPRRGRCSSRRRDRCHRRGSDRSACREAIGQPTCCEQQHERDRQPNYVESPGHGSPLFVELSSASVLTWPMGRSPANCHVYTWAVSRECNPDVKLATILGGVHAWHLARVAHVRFLCVCFACAFRSDRPGAQLQRLPGSKEGCAVEMRVQALGALHVCDDSADVESATSAGDGRRRHVGRDVTLVAKGKSDTPADRT
jgi:hypothetical protein